FDRIAAKHPERTALAYRSALSGEEESLTYEGLKDKILRAAAAFSSVGVGKGDRVAIVHRNDPAFIVSYFALARLGAAAVPINFMVQNPEELRFMLGHSGAKGVVTQKDFLKGILAAKQGLALSSVWVSDDASASGETQPFWSWAESFAPFNGSVPVSPEDTAAILYTSGTTGIPKGVMLTHANLASNADGTCQAIDLSSEDVWIALLPMFHSFCWTVCVMIPLRMGAKVVISPCPAPLEPWLALLKRHGVTNFTSVPQIYALLANKAAGYLDYALKEGFFKTVRFCFSGAAPLSPMTHQAFKEAFGLEIIEGYGLTETAPIAALNRSGRVKVGSVGQPLPGGFVRIVDEAGKELAVGMEGEIEIKGPSVMKGYFKNEEATREAIGPEGWFKSGDIGALDEEGFLFIRDRKKDMIIVGGLKVYPAQVENVLATHPAVQEAVVIGIPEGAGEERIKAFLVLRKGASADILQLHQFCRQNLDPYKRPKDIEIVEELPKNTLQKTLKRVLREREITKRAAQPSKVPA
ncbi:MAG: AMP-binding protein, partial [Elusimicrobia bacterium]|nr:AMP-binding protein [Elusimicrobiota bacterium]